MRIVLPLLALVACTDGTPTDTGPQGPPLDPDVESWSPDFAPLPTVDNVFFFGDSITAGFGISNPDNRYTELVRENNDARYPGYAGNDLTSRYGEPVHVRNFGISGAETPTVLSAQIPAMRTAFGDRIPGPTLIVVTIGGNDLINALATGGLDTIARELEDSFEAIALELTDPEQFPDGVLLMMTNVYEPTDGTGQTDACFFGLDVSTAEPVLTDLNDRLRTLAEDIGFAYVDLRGHFNGHGFNHDDPDTPAYDAEDPSLWFQPDCIHPNRRGHHELRRLVLAAADNTPLEREILAE